jgi:flavin reductase (DIM6/NTAB) family NADH-FMN oxidoreductase RutF
MPPQRLLQRLQLLAGLEPHRFSGRDGDFRSGTGIPADTRFTGLHIEDAEAAQLDSVAMLEGPFHRLENGFDGHFGLRLGDTGPADDFVDDIEFNQFILLRTGRSATHRTAVDLPVVIGQLYDRIEFILMSSKPSERLRASLGKNEFRAALGRFATGVTIAAVADREGTAHGITVSSLTSVSLEPPLILIAVGHAATVYAHFRAAKRFGINVLREEQRHIAEHFARKGQDRFEDVEWYAGESGVPLIPGVLAAIECERVKTVTAGDHDIFIAETTHARVTDGRPLIYFAGAYGGVK